MPKFKFRLATVLKLREATRDQRRTALAEAYRVDAVLQQRMEALSAEMQDLREQCRRAAGPGPVQIDHLVTAQRYELTLQSQQAQLTQQRQTVAAEIDRRREALTAANRDVRVLEMLREKQAERHRHEEDRRDIGFLDEVAQQHAVREAQP